MLSWGHCLVLTPALITALRAVGFVMRWEETWGAAERDVLSSLLVQLGGFLSIFSISLLWR